MVKVSVILPSLNVVKYIEKAILSVRNQTLTDIEIICVDAGSNDGTREVIVRHVEQDNRVLLLDSPIKSYGYQVNLGLAGARGEYVAILETDDYVDGEMYEKLYIFAKNNELDYAKCDYAAFSVDEAGREVFSERHISDNNAFYNQTFVPSLYSNTSVEDWYLWNGLYRMDFLRDNGIVFSETRGAAFQDIGFLHKTTAKASKVRYLNASLYRYCVDRPEASSKSNKTICFIRSEYGLLLNAIGDCCSIEENRLLYCRMAKSFARACMDCSEDQLLDPEIQKICKWFQIRLLEAENRGFVHVGELPVGLRGAYMNLINPARGYLSYRQLRRKSISEFFRGHTTVIFGCGLYGKEAKNFLDDLSIGTDFFMDNSEKLWGTYVSGIEVMGPDDIGKMPNDARFLIANENHSETIFNQLKEYVDEKRLYIF